MDFRLALFCLLTTALDCVLGAPNGLGDCNPACTFELRPVCGSDFITYPNECALRFADCVAQQVINKRIDKYYDGECSTGLAPAILRSQGGSDECPRICTMDFRPVCGTDTKTYPNVCSFQAAACELKKKGQHILILKHGKCIGDCVKPCTLEYAQVCGSNGLTYPNICHMQVASCVSEASGLDSITLKNRKPCPVQLPSS